MLRSNLALLVCMMMVGAMLACGGAQTDANEPTTGEPATGESAATTEPAGTDTEGTTQAVEGEEAAPEGDAPRGRMMFTQCTDPRADVCTKEYRPVCGVVDTGVRCIAAPCDGATEQRNFGNACMACAEAKTTGYWPVACEELGSDAR